MSVASLPLVFIHGWGANKRLWQDWAEAAFPQRQLVFVELPGHGEQIPLAIDTDEDVEAAWLATVVAQLPPQAVLVGWSLGGLMAQAIALRYPERVSALILLASSPCFVQRADWLPALEKGLFARYLSEVLTHTQTLLKSFLSLQSLGDAKPRQLMKNLLPLLSMVGQTGGVTSLRQGLFLLEQLDFRAQLKQLQQPTLWLLADQDAIVPMQLADELVALQPQARIYVIQQSSHLPFMSQPEQTAQLIHLFLQEQTR